MIFDFTFRIGDLIVLMAAALIAYKNLSKQEFSGEEASRRINALEVEIKKQTEILERLAEQGERMNGLGQRIQALETKAR